MMQPRRIGHVETPEWRELYDFYRRLERRERMPRFVALAIAVLPLAIGVLSVAH